MIVESKNYKASVYKNEDFRDLVSMHATHLLLRRPL